MHSKNVEILSRIEEDQESQRYNGFSAASGAKRPETISYEPVGGFDWGTFSHWLRIDGSTIELHFHGGVMRISGRGLLTRNEKEPNKLSFLEQLVMKRIKSVWISKDLGAECIDSVEIELK